MLHWYQVWKQMHTLTNREVEKAAVLEMFNYLEKLTDSVISQSIHEFDDLNSIRKTQGLPEKTRIDRECVKRAIKSINKDTSSVLSERTGGKIQEEIKKGEQNVEHPSETKDMGVEII